MDFGLYLPIVGYSSNSTQYDRLLASQCLSVRPSVRFYSIFHWINRWLPGIAYCRPPTLSPSFSFKVRTRKFTSASSFQNQCVPQTATCGTVGLYVTSVMPWMSCIAAFWAVRASESSVWVIPRYLFFCRCKHDSPGSACNSSITDIIMSCLL